MSELLELSPLGSILNSCVPNDDKETHNMLCCSYLNDYILSAYKPNMVDEQQVILLKLHLVMANYYAISKNAFYYYGST